MAKPSDKTPDDLSEATHHDENAKSRDSLIPARKPGQDPEDVADRMGSTGSSLGISPKPGGG